MTTTLQLLADQYHAAQILRLEKDAEAKKLLELETELKEKLLQRMIEEKLTAIGGQTCIVRYHRKLKPTPKDWHKIWGHIQATGEFELLHRRLSAKAVQERWDEGIEIPGVERFPVDYLIIATK